MLDYKINYGESKQEIQQIRELTMKLLQRSFQKYLFSVNNDLEDVS